MWEKGKVNFWNLEFGKSQNLIFQMSKFKTIYFKNLRFEILEVTLLGVKCPSLPTWQYIWCINEKWSRSKKWHIFQLWFQSRRVVTPIAVYMAWIKSILCNQQCLGVWYCSKVFLKYFCEFNKFPKTRTYDLNKIMAMIYLQNANIFNEKSYNDKKYIHKSVAICYRYWRQDQYYSHLHITFRRDSSPNNNFTLDI